MLKLQNRSRVEIGLPLKIFTLIFSKIGISRLAKKVHPISPKCGMACHAESSGAMV